jgi:hypothetical protein
MSTATKRKKTNNSRVFSRKPPLLFNQLENRHKIGNTKNNSKISLNINKYTNLHFVLLVFLTLFIQNIFLIFRITTFCLNLFFPPRSLFFLSQHSKQTNEQLHTITIVSFFLGEANFSRDLFFDANDVSRLVTIMMMTMTMIMTMGDRTSSTIDRLDETFLHNSLDPWSRKRSHHHRSNPWIECLACPLISEWLEET